MQIKPISAFADNYIWAITDTDHKLTAVIDPGDANPVFAFLEENHLKLTAILVTHHHADHIGGIPALINEFPVPVYGPANEQIPNRTYACHDGDHIRINNLSLTMTILSIPGHTNGHIAYYNGHDALFCGDTLFTAGCGRLFEGTPMQMLQSLQRIAQLPENTLIYCAHEYTEKNLRFALQVEPDNIDIQKRLKITQEQRNRNMPSIPSTLNEEKLTNPFLRTHLPSIKQAAENFLNKKLYTEVDVFSAIRHWKDLF